MKKIETSVVIDASIETVWNVIIDLKNYSHWNPFITQSENNLEIGDINHIKICVSGSKPQFYDVKIVENIPFKKLCWLGHFHIPGLIDGYHCFELDRYYDKTIVLHYEYYSGLLVPFVFYTFLNTKLKKSFLDLNEALKKKCENTGNLLNPQNTYLYNSCHNKLN